MASLPRPSLPPRELPTPPPGVPVTGRAAAAHAPPADPFQSMPGPRFVHDCTCDNAGAGRRSGGAAQRRGGSSCASERPTRAFPVAPLASRPCKDRALPPTALYFRFLLARDGGLPATECSRSRPERLSAAILHPMRPRLPPCSLQFSVVREASVFEVVGTAETQKLLYIESVKF